MKRPFELEYNRENEPNCGRFNYKTKGLMSHDSYPNQGLVVDESL